MTECLTWCSLLSPSSIAHAEFGQESLGQESEQRLTPCAVRAVSMLHVDASAVSVVSGFPWSAVCAASVWLAAVCAVLELPQARDTRSHSVFPHLQTVQIVRPVLLRALTEAGLYGCATVAPLAARRVLPAAPLPADSPCPAAAALAPPASQQNGSPPETAQIRWHRGCLQEHTFAGTESAVTKWSAFWWCAMRGPHCLRKATRG